MLYAPHNTKKVRHVYKSKCKEKRENKVILLMITDFYEEICQRIKATTTTSIAFVYSEQKVNLNLIRMCVKIMILSRKMVHNKILNYNQKQKSIKISFAVYSNTESSIEKIRTCGNNQK